MLYEPLYLVGYFLLIMAHVFLTAVGMFGVLHTMFTVMDEIEKHENSK